MKITQFTMEEVRCFAGRQQLEIRPLTFLVGENSTGKTTALACIQALTNYLEKDRLDFNVAPYSMGTFRDIVRRSKRPEKSFRLGLTFESKTEKVECTVEFVEKAGGFEPAVRSVTLGFADGEIVFRTDDSVELMDLVWADQERNQYRIGVEPGYFEWHMQLDGPLTKLFEGTDFFDKNGEGRTECENSLRDFVMKKYWSIHKGRDYVNEWGILEGIDVISTSPIRSQPKRTYDLTVEYNDPEGSDVPMRLMRIEATKKDDWKSLKRRLDEFGKRSGLFQSFDVKNLGRSMGSPFQLKVKVRGPTANIMDVGYGVSQVLPILEQILNEPFSRRRGASARHSCYLLQQPEVHLHPRAQAELSSLLGQLASRGNQSFIIETHSDYLIDRARIDIMKGNISKDDVSLIYFEPKKNVVNVHNISFDEMGNMIGVPPHFRAFFLLESDRLMGFAD